MNARTLLFCFCTCLFSVAAWSQVPSMLNYQGRIQVGNNQFHGTGHFKFALVNGTGPQSFWSNDGTSVAGSQPAAAVSLDVVKGLYAVQLGDTTLANMTALPPGVFANPDVRLRIWFNDGANGFQQLTPDQRIVAVGYAIMAGSVADGAITAAKVAPNTFLQVGGNASGGPLVVGTTDNQPLELRAHNTAGLRLLGGGLPTAFNVVGNTINVVGGSPANSVASGIGGVTLFGGGPPLNPPFTLANAVESASSTISGGNRNSILGAESFESAIGGGSGHTIQNHARYATIGGGVENTVLDGAIGAVIGGGEGNLAGARGTAVGGGASNRAEGEHASVPGGYQNKAAGQYSFAAGRQAKANHRGSFVWADSFGSDLASPGNDTFTARATGGFKLHTANAGLPLMSLEPSGDVYVNGNLHANNLPFVKHVQYRVPGLFTNQTCGEEYTLCELTVNAPGPGVLVVRGHAALWGICTAGGVHGHCNPADNWDLLTQFSAFFPSREAARAGRIGIALWDAPGSGDPTNLSSSGRELEPDVFREYNAARLDVSSVVTLSGGTKTLRLTARNTTVGTFAEYGLVAMYFPMGP